jgi:hypothetical protein
MVVVFPISPEKKEKDVKPIPDTCFFPPTNLDRQHGRREKPTTLQ